jgi:hypothetical protein
MSNRRNKQAKPLRAAKRGMGKPKKSQEKRSEIMLIPTYPRQVCWDVWLPVTPFKEVTTVTTGLINSVYTVSTANISSFATRFGSTFDEYRIVQADLTMRLFSSTNPGVIQCWFDEQSTAVPTLVEAEERYISSVSAGAVESKPRWRWTCSDPKDLQYQPIGTSYVPVTFKFFTNNANFGSSIVATDYFEIESRFRMQFRGLLGV